jgi:hypothetical protein
MIAFALVANQVASPTSAMRADVKALVARAAKQPRLWPWDIANGQIARVVRHGPAIAPLLLALLPDDPENSDPVIDERIQQHAALALCRIFGVVEECGHVYCNRASRDTNLGIRAFWVSKVAAGR